MKKWIVESQKILRNPKFIKRGTKVLIDPKTLPQACEVDGRFGKRPMYVVESREHGLIYVTPMQLVEIVRIFDGKYESAVTVEL